ncbi:MAG: PHP domain-containing protein [Aeromicrobium sp.]|uniref:PHP domain-containing protein n=1 Tax=Aeromicrobium sp. TaxID=1871063 RepID=UPI0025BBE871|nr:PHP domain-containing protein [Aeromicrobium sp.]MCK5892466.1 PHP domain-containing protein [Aeromicrobium sp.]MDF1704029.1 PHP domain-containing protein [Aeromicrobium sp.]
MDPIEALDEIGFWLERGRASSYRVEAFRKAARLLEGRSAASVRDLAAQGRLRDLPGIGERTATVLAQALAGDVPDYLADLREQGRGPVVEGGEAVRAALRGDLHVHSDWSDGGSPIHVMARTAQWLGHEYIALTDHSPRLTVANGLSAHRLAEQLDVVAAVDAELDDFRLLAGIEVDILEDGTLDQTPTMLDRLDIVVASVHSKLRSDRRTMTRRMLRAVEDPHTTVLGHCTGQLVGGSRGTRPPSEFDAAAVFAACAEHGVAVEVNARPDRADPPDDLLRLAVDLGCLFSIDSDAHAPGQLDFLDHGCVRVAGTDLPLDRIVTTWPVDRLLAWSHAGR